MYNCIFSDHCTEDFCDNSCPTLVETSYLLERNGISMNSSVFLRDERYIDKTLSVLDKAEGKFKTIVATNTVNTSEMITYCAICKNWQGSRLHCNVYNLRFSKYIEELKRSWTTKMESESLEYMRIWSEGAKVLIISHLDYVNFGDYESQTLLSLIQSRESNKDLTTLVVVPNISLLSGRGLFFSRLQEILGKAVL